MSTDQHLHIIGFGEVGKTFAAQLAGKPGIARITAWDARWRDASPDANDLHIANTYGANLAQFSDFGIRQATLVMSAVTASNTLAVAQEFAPWLQPGAIFLDLNSASPGTKQQCAALIHATGANYVEAGVMTSVPPYGIKVPMLLGGAHANEIAPTLNAWGMDVKVVSEKIGVASAIKMCRSVMIKGLEALVIESYTTARAYGVEDYVLPTLEETFPSIDWEKQGDYFFQRVVQHGKRRSEEMFEAANTVREGVLAPIMTTAIAERQKWISERTREAVLKRETKAWREHADALIALKRD